MVRKFRISIAVLTFSATLLLFIFRFQIKEEGTGALLFTGILGGFLLLLFLLLRYMRLKQRRLHFFVFETGTQQTVKYLLMVVLLLIAGFSLFSVFADGYISRQEKLFMINCIFLCAGYLLLLLHPSYISSLQFDTEQVGCSAAFSKIYPWAKVRLVRIDYLRNRIRLFPLRGSAVELNIPAALLPGLEEGLLRCGLADRLLIVK